MPSTTSMDANWQTRSGIETLNAMYMSLPSTPPGSMTRSVTEVTFMKSLNSSTNSAPMTTAAITERIGPEPVPSVNSFGTCAGAAPRCGEVSVWGWARALLQPVGAGSSALSLAAARLALPVWQPQTEHPRRRPDASEPEGCTHLAEVVETAEVHHRGPHRTPAARQGRPRDAMCLLVAPRFARGCSADALRGAVRCGAGGCGRGEASSSCEARRKACADGPRRSLQGGGWLCGGRSSGVCRPPMMDLFH